MTFIIEIEGKKERERNNESKMMRISLFLISVILICKLLVDKQSRPTVEMSQIIKQNKNVIAKFN